MFVTLTVCLSLGEALGAIGDAEVLDLLKEFSHDPVIEVGTYCIICNYVGSGIKATNWVAVAQEVEWDVH